MGRGVLARALLATLSLAVSGCGFPSPFACSENADCLEGRCDPATSRCVAQTDSGPATDARPSEEGGNPSDAEAPADAADSRPFCARICPAEGACEGLLSVRNPSFEAPELGWVFEPPSHRTHASVDGEVTQFGGWIGEARVDWYAADAVDDSGFEQSLPVESLPAGRYRLCFNARVVSGADTCFQDLVAAHGAYLLDAGERTTIWDESSAEWCPEATERSPYWTTPWAPMCVAFERTRAWQSPGLGFFVHREGPWENHRGHALSVDDLRLFALDCESAE